MSLTTALSVLMLLPTSARADQAMLQARPGNCVSLRKGLVCYQRVRLSWKAPSSDDYCLLAANDKAPLQCWSNASEGETVYSFASESDQQFYLSRANSATPLAQARVTVSWVYKSKSRRRRSWRLF